MYTQLREHKITIHYICTSSSINCWQNCCSAEQISNKMFVQNFITCVKKLSTWVFTSIF